MAVVFGIGALVLVAEKLQHDHAVTVTSAQYEYELRKQREADERKYRDADLARQADKGLRPDGD